MDLTAHQIDLIDAFLRGELEANALDEFKLLVETNSVFKEELEQKRSLQTTMMRKGYMPRILPFTQMIMFV